MNRDNKRASHTAAPIRVEAGALRDHGDAERIDRVWERLEPKLTLGRSARHRVAARQRTGRWPMVAVAVAAGFAMGIATSGWLADDAKVLEAVAPDTSGGEHVVDVFAAGTSQRSYPLPGGGTITLTPGSIVDTISRDGNALTLRLVRGDATLVSPAGASSIELMVGSAHVATAAGAHMQVRRDGDHALLQMFEGSADVTAPNRDNEMTATRLGPNDTRRVRIHISTASLPVDERPHHPSRRSDDLVDEGDTTPEDVPAATPAWVIACNEKDDVRTLQLLQQEPGALAKVTDPQVLACVARGQKFTGHEDGAIATYEKLMQQSDTLRAFYAAKTVTSIVTRRRNAAQTDAERQKYAVKLQTYAQQERKLALDAVAKGIDLTAFIGAEGMCRQIVAEAGRANPNWEAVANLSAQYKKAFGTGDCIATIDGILAKRPAPESDADGSDGSPAPAEASPYDGTEE